MSWLVRWIMEKVKNNAPRKANMSKSKPTTAASLVWFEVPADDLERAKKFSRTLSGWKIAPFPGMQNPGAQNYLHIDTGGGNDTPDGGMMLRQHPQQPITQYVGVESVTKSAAKVEQVGGKICVARTAVPQMGCFAVCPDTEGKTFALWEMSK